MKELQTLQPDALVARIKELFTLLKTYDPKLFEYIVANTSGATPKVEIGCDTEVDGDMTVNDVLDLGTSGTLGTNITTAIQAIGGGSKIYQHKLVFTTSSTSYTVLIYSTISTNINSPQLFVQTLLKNYISAIDNNTNTPLFVLFGASNCVFVGLQNSSGIQLKVYAQFSSMTTVGSVTITDTVTLL